MISGEIKTILTMDDKDFSVKAVKAGQTISHFKRSIDQTASSVKKVEQHFSSFGHKFRDVTLSISLMRFALQDIYDILLRFPLSIAKATGEIERMQKLMEGLSRETDTYKKQVEAANGVQFVFNMAQNAPFNVKALTDSFVKFRTAGLDPTRGGMQALVDSVARFGGSSEHLHRASIAIQQMAGKGVVSMEELRQQLGEAVPSAIKSMADGMGMSMQELVKHISKGEVAAGAALNRMLTVMQIDNKGAAAAMMETWTGMVEKMKTKWMLFQVEIGKSEFFESAKEQLQEILNAFDAPKMKKIADDIGRALTGVVDALKEGARLWGVYGEAIKEAGKIFLAYFVVSKVQSLASKFGGSDIGQAFKKERQMTIDAMREREALRQQELQKQIQFTEQKIAANKVSIRRQLQDARLANQQKAAMLDAEVVKANAAADAKLVLQQRELNAARDMTTQKMALERQASGVDLRTEQGRMRQALLRKEAVAAREAARAASERANALAHEAFALQSSAAADAAKAAATRSTTIATTTNTAALAAHNAMLGGHIDGLKKQAQATSGVTFATGLMKGALSGLKSVFYALGGWVGIALTAITYLGQKLYEFVNRWKNVDDIIRRTKQGMGSEDDKKELDDRIREKESTIAKLKADMNKGSTATGSLAREAERKIKAAEIRKHEAELERMQNAHTEQKRLIEEDGINAEVTNFQRNIERGVNEKAKAINSSLAFLDKAQEDALAAYRKKNPKASAEDEKRIVSEFIESRNAIRKKFAEDQKREVQALSDSLTQQIAQETDVAQRKVLEAKKAVIDKQIAEGADDLVANTKKFGDNDWRAAAKTNKTATDHLKDKTSEARARLAEARVELDNLLQDATTYADVRKQVEAEMRVLWENDKIGIDTTDENGKKTSIKHAWDGDKIQGLIDDKTALKIIDQAKQNLSQIKGKLAPMKAELARELELLEKGDFTTKATGKNENAALKMLESMAAKSSTAKAELQGVIDSMKEMELVAVKLDAAKAAREAGSQAENIRISLLETERERRAAMQAKELADHDAHLERQLDKLREHGQSTVEIEEHFANLRKAIQDKHVRESESQLDKLARQWNDTAEQMNQATAKWANSFVDMMVQGADTGKYEWRKMLRQWLLDLYRINLQKSISELMNKAFSGIGNFLSGLMEGKGGSIGDIFKNLFGGVSKESDTVTNALKTLTSQGVNETTKGMVESVAKLVSKDAAELQATSSVLRLAMAAEQAAIALSQISGGGGLGSLSSGFGGGSFFGDMFGDSGAPDSWFDMQGAAESMISLDSFGFANGGIMTQFGPAALRRYANGGIANSPQLAMYGEGSTPEAFVPLPDGRSIPVTVSGEGGNNISISIVVNKDGGESASEAGDAQVWRDMANRVKTVVQQELVDQQRPGGLLYR